MSPVKTANRECLVWPRGPRVGLRSRRRTLPAAAAPQRERRRETGAPEDVKKGLDEVAAVTEESTEDIGVLRETGELVSPVPSEISAKFPGRVGKVFVEEGARVRKGQPLLELETDYLKIDVEPRPRPSLARAKAAEGEARRDFESERKAWWRRARSRRRFSIAPERRSIRPRRCAPRRKRHSPSPAEARGRGDGLAPRRHHRGAQDRRRRAARRGDGGLRPGADVAA